MITTTVNDLNPDRDTSEEQHEVNINSTRERDLIKSSLFEMLKDRMLLRMKRNTIKRANKNSGFMLCLDFSEPTIFF